ncbi:hypothetical protein GCM10009663_72650 [Kitasatospora arboriphila]|uniref:Uncharacterized protein n=1 Tax=Kitasatospora arboriphila TaxID=258052 RepID=A0ABP4ESG5_9ACTN
MKAASAAFTRSRTASRSIGLAGRLVEEGTVGLRIIGLTISLSGGRPGPESGVRANRRGRAGGPGHAVSHVHVSFSGLRLVTLRA